MSGAIATSRLEPFTNRGRQYYVRGVPTIGHPRGDSNQFQSHCSNGRHLGRA